MSFLDRVIDNIPTPVEIIDESELPVRSNYGTVAVAGDVWLRERAQRYLAGLPHLRHPGHANQKVHGHGGGGEIRQSLQEARTASAVTRVFMAEAKQLTGRRIYAEFYGSADTAREHAEGVLRGLERFPNAKLRSVHAGGAEPAYAHDAAGRIHFNEEYGSAGGRRKYLESLKKDTAGWDQPRLEFGETVPGHGWHPRGVDNPTAIALHEFGHVLDIETLSHRIRPGVDDVLKRRTKEFNADLKKRREAAGLQTFEVGSRHVIEREVSGYATKNHNELVAESFADVMMNGSKASPLSREIFDLLEAEYQKGAP